MSAVLLDTHVLVWLLAKSAKLGINAREAIDVAATTDGVFVSAISTWEIAMLVAKGKLVLARDTGEWIAAALALPGVKLEPLAPEIAVASTRLPGDINGDPVDRIIVATARHLGIPLVTADNNLLEYSAAGQLLTIRASE